MMDDSGRKGDTAVGENHDDEAFVRTVRKLLSSPPAKGEKGGGRRKATSGLDAVSKAGISGEEDDGSGSELAPTSRYGSGHSPPPKRATR